MNDEDYEKVIEQLKEKVKRKEYQYGKLSNKYGELKSKKDLFIKKLKEEIPNKIVDRVPIDTTIHKLIDQKDKEIFKDEN